jgi:hypothetical protein
MAITSWGYPGSLTVDPVKWAKLQQALGVRYMVTSAAALLATPVQAGSRQVQLAAGGFGGHGVYDESTGELVQLPTVASGTRYFMLVARRTWGVTKTTTIEVIDAGTSPATLPARNTERGVIDDQPLWLVPLAAGASVPGTPIDLRLIGTDRGVFHANSDLVRQYATWEGVEIIIGSERWRRGASAGSVGAWYSERLAPGDKWILPVVSGNGVIVPATNWSATNPTSLINRAYRDGNHVGLWLQLRLASGQKIEATNPGNFPDTVIGTVTAPFRPPVDTPFAFLYRGGFTAGSALVGGVGDLKTTGEVALISNSGDYTLFGDATLYSVRAHISFLQAS